jgi:hypothetical protein
MWLLGIRTLAWIPMWSTELPDRPGRRAVRGGGRAGQGVPQRHLVCAQRHSAGPADTLRFGLVGDQPVVWSVSQCSPAYPTVCIPPPPPDLDCPQVPFPNFRVLAPDPHRFDGNRDGIGCET